MHATNHTRKRQTEKSKILVFRTPVWFDRFIRFFLLLHFFFNWKAFWLFFSFVISSFYMILWKRPKRHTYTQNKMEQHNNNKTKKSKKKSLKWMERKRMFRWITYVLLVSFGQKHCTSNVRWFTQQKHNTKTRKKIS